MARIPTQKLSKQLMIKKGYYVADTEQVIRGTMFSTDLLGFIDILAIGDLEFIGVQTTTASHLNERYKKILCLASAIKWLQNKGKIELHGWRVDGSVEIKTVTLEDFSEVEKTKAVFEVEFKYKRKKKGLINGYLQQ